MEMTEFWDRSGRSVAYVADDGKSVYLWDGSPVAWISDGGVYGYNGRFLGWFDDGWIRDLSGACVFSTDDSAGGPVQPVRQVRPVRGVRGVRPVRGVRQVRPVRPISSLSWSALSGDEFFSQ